MPLRKAMSIFQPPARFLSHKVISFEVKAVERLVPDRLLLFYLNTLDKRIPPKAINGIINGLDKLPPKVRSSLISAADEYVPDAVASSRKVSAVISGVYKYVPDRIIPPDSAQNWANVKTKFHIPTLISRDSRAVEN
ncbi:hypothetical protein ACFLXV_02870 [Chloroflexota bacterium]